MHDILHCQVAGLEIGTELDTLDSEMARNRKVLDSELTRNGGHWNWNWLGIGLTGLVSSPSSVTVSRRGQISNN